MPYYAFRGQPDATLRLRPTIERAVERGGFPIIDGTAAENIVFQQEQWIVREFQRQAHHHLSHPPPETSLLDWHALIQHHGGPTRLLDFTYSFYVAAFFAMEHSDADAAVWAIDLEVLTERRARILPRDLAHPTDRRSILGLNNSLAEAWLAQTPEEVLVVDVEPFKAGLRMAAQQGMFLMPSRVDISFVHSLARTFGIDPEELDAKATDAEPYQVGDEIAPPYVVKILLPYGGHGLGLSDLRTMNVTASSLFGGLDGLARSLAHFLWLIDPTA